jgi:Na+/H+-dicarboxylate symporter
MTDAAAPARPRIGFAAQVFIGVAAGLLLGFVARAIGGGAEDPNWLLQALDLTGSIFVQLLRALVPPLVFTAIVASIANLRSLQGAAGLAWATLLWFAITALIAVSIGLALGLLLEPGLNAGIAASTAALPETTGTWLDFLKGIVPANPLGLTVSSKVVDAAVTSTLTFNVLQIVVIGIVIGFAAIRTGARAEPFLAFNQSLLDIVRRILWWVIRLTPIGTAGLLGTAIAKYGWETLAQLGWFAGTVYLGLGLVLLVVYPALLLAHGLRPAAFFAGAWPAIQLGFVSRSSIGTMPVTEAGHGSQSGRAARLCRLCRAARLDDQDGRVRRRLSRRRRAVRGAVLRHSAACAGLSDDSGRVGARLGRHRGADRRDRHADAYLVDARPAARGRGAAAGDRPDHRHGADRGQCGWPGAGPDDRRQAARHPRSGALRLRRRRRPARHRLILTFALTISGLDGSRLSLSERVSA